MERGIVSAVNGRRARVKRPDGYVTGWLFLADAVLSVNAGDIVFYEPFGNDGLILHAVGAPVLADVFALANEVLPLSGGSLTGDLDINGNAVWHAGNLHNSSALCDLYLYGATTAGNPQYSVQYSEYTRVGDQVDVSFRFELTNLGGMDGGIRVGNLPFEADSTSTASTTQLHVSNITRPGIIAVAAQVQAGTTYALLRIMYETSGTIGEGALAASHMANDSIIKGIISYKAA